MPYQPDKVSIRPTMALQSRRTVQDQIHWLQNEYDNTYCTTNVLTLRSAGESQSPKPGRPERPHGQDRRSVSRRVGCADGLSFFVHPL